MNNIFVLLVLFDVIVTSTVMSECLAENLAQDRLPPKSNRTYLYTWVKNFIRVNVSLQFNFAYSDEIPDKIYFGRRGFLTSFCPQKQIIVDEIPATQDMEGISVPCNYNTKNFPAKFQFNRAFLNDSDQEARVKIANQLKSMATAFTKWRNSMEDKSKEFASIRNILKDYATLSSISQYGEGPKNIHT